MKPGSSLLLDTHILLWWLAASPRLSRGLMKLISAGGEMIVVSPVVAWEIEIKRAAGKLDCPDNIDEQIAANGFTVLPVSLRHAVVAGRLPLHHKDPFDRLLIAQAQVEELTVMTADMRFAAYGVDLIPA